jgi:hypothetical protein
LRHGRGNLQPDNEVTGGMSQKLTEASYILQEEHGMVAHVASALVLGAGNCDVYGLAAALEHAPKLQPGETVHAVSIPGFHTWSQSRSPDHPDIDGDGWANGPAIESSDANFQATNDKHDFTVQEGLELFEAVQAEAAAYANPESPLHRELKDALDEACRVSLEPPSYGVSNQVISAEFATNAREALAAQSAFTQQIVAVDVARRAYDVSVKVAARSAPAVAAAAHQLDDLPRPPVQPIEE